MADEIIDLSEIEVFLAEWRESRRAGGPGSGRFARAPKGPLDGRASTDFVVLDYTTGPWPLAPSEQDARVAVLQSFQDPETGLFPARRARARADADVAGEVRQGRADDLSTAYFLSALEVLGARALHPLRAYDAYRTPEGVDRLLEGGRSSDVNVAPRRGEGCADWSPSAPCLPAGRHSPTTSAPGDGSPDAAAVAWCLAVTGDVGFEWFERLFARLSRAADPATGLLYKRPRASGRGACRGRPSTDSLAASCGLYLIYDRLRHPLPRPDRVVRTVLALQGRDGLFDPEGPGWLDLDAAFVLDAAFRQSGVRFRDVRSAMNGLARATAERLADDRFRERVSEDPHGVAGLLSLLAVLSRVLPGSVKSRRPLRFFLDRHLFV